MCLLAVLQGRIAIVGGGIAGLVTAPSLRHHCHDQDIKIGARVGMSLNAARILDKIGLFDRAHEITGNVWLSFRRYDTGDEIVTIREYEEGIVMQAPVHQAEFLELLYGTTAVADLGIMHFVATSDRHYHQNYDARYRGTAVYRGLCPISKLEEWDLDLGEAKESWTLASDKASVRMEFDKFDITVHHIIIQHMNTNPLRWVFAGGKVALVGDAAHAMVPRYVHPSLPILPGGTYSI
ncbi:hypothetical protein M432DRAFT_630157 [Thermoascus aurantiacus ATCC 26904]